MSFLEIFFCTFDCTLKFGTVGILILRDPNLDLVTSLGKFYLIATLLSGTGQPGSLKCPRVKKAAADHDFFLTSTKNCEATSLRLSWKICVS